MIATYTAPSARAADGSMVITVLAVSIVAVKSMSAPFSSVVFSVSMASRSPFSSAVPAASLRTASEKVTVTLPDASVSRRAGRPG